MLLKAVNCLDCMRNKYQNIIMDYPTVVAACILHSHIWYLHYSAYNYLYLELSRVLLVNASRGWFNYNASSMLTQCHIYTSPQLVVSGNSHIPFIYPSPSLSHQTLNHIHAINSVVKPTNQQTASNSRGQLQ